MQLEHLSYTNTKSCNSLFSMMMWYWNTYVPQHLRPLLYCKTTNGSIISNPEKVSQNQYFHTLLAGTWNTTKFWRESGYFYHKETCYCVDRIVNMLLRWLWTDIFMLNDYRFVSIVLHFQLLLALNIYETMPYVSFLWFMGSRTTSALFYCWVKFHPSAQEVA